MKQQSAKLQMVTTGSGLMVTLVYTDDRVMHVDLSDVVRRLKVFAPLENQTEFETANITDFGWSLEWSCGASLDSDRLIEMALEQQGMASNVAFRRWQDAHALSLSGAAQAIGMTRRTVSQYRTGARPVPRTVTLACKGWEAEQKHGLSTV